ncbi:MAG: hypothetical protein MMC33_000694 [Icmadophila ericetorum]|nr:hypothetical protein [Icmadophila ericetorum]
MHELRKPREAFIEAIVRQVDQFEGQLIHLIEARGLALPLQCQPKSSVEHEDVDHDDINEPAVDQDGKESNIHRSIGSMQPRVEAAAALGLKYSINCGPVESVTNEDVAEPSTDNPDQDSATNRNSANPHTNNHEIPVSLEEDHQKARGQLQKVMQEFATLSAAHDKLKERCNFFKEETRKYRVFYEKWLLETGKKKTFKRKVNGPREIQTSSSNALSISLSPARSILSSSEEPRATGEHRIEAASNTEELFLQHKEEPFTIAEHCGPIRTHTQESDLIHTQESASLPEKQSFTVADQHSQAPRDTQAFILHHNEEPFTIVEHMGPFRAPSILCSSPAPNEERSNGNDETNNEPNRASDHDASKESTGKSPISPSDGSVETCDDTTSQTLIRSSALKAERTSIEAAEENDSDVPVIVSGRSLKRKRSNSTRENEIVIHEDQPIPIKSESTFDTPVIQQQGTLPAFTHDSLDLDEVGGTGFTPRKRKRFDNQLTASQIQGASKAPQFGFDTQRDNFDELGKIFADYLRNKNQNRRLNQPQEGLDLNDGRLGSQSQRESNRRIVQRFYAPMGYGDLNIQHLEHDRLNSAEPSALNAQFSAVRGHSEPTNPSTHYVQRAVPAFFRTTNPTALQPKNSNAQIISRNVDRRVSSKSGLSSTRHGRTAAKVSKLAEDGENYFPDGDAQKASCSIDDLNQHQNRTRSGPVTTRAIENLLEGRTPDRPILPFPRKSTSKLSRSRSPVVTATPARPKVLDQNRSLQDLPEDSKPATAKKLQAPLVSKPSPHTLGRLRTLRESDLRPRPTSSAEKPLRDQPLDHLRLEDFKINPASNQDIAFAFNEPNRSREQRKCLPNCNKPGCCGEKFRKLMEIGGFATPDKSSVGQFSTMSRQDEENMLLDYSGKSREEIVRLSESERRRLVTNVQARMFGDKYGKHKQNQRPTTPPGFWRTDMPTTQEARADREAALLGERQQVKERYLDALQANGRWKFRDE